MRENRPRLILIPSFLHQHFQSVLQTLEEQVAGERQRLVETHLVRVEAILNNNRRLALENYLAAVQSDPPQVSPEVQAGPARRLFNCHLTQPVLHPDLVLLQPERVLQALKRYMAVEQKDRRHTLTHYQHIVTVDPQKAEQMKFQVRRLLCSELADILNPAAIHGECWGSAGVHAPPCH